MRLKAFAEGAGVAVDLAGLSGHIRGFLILHIVYPVVYALKAIFFDVLKCGTWTGMMVAAR